MSRITADLETKIHARISECLRRAYERYGRDFSYPEVTYNLRGDYTIDDMDEVDRG